MTVAGIFMLLLMAGVLQVCWGGEFTTMPQQLILVQGETATLECGVRGTSDPFIWMFTSKDGDPDVVAIDKNVMLWSDQVEIEARTNGDSVSRILRISESGLEQEGTYICKVGSALKQRSTITIDVPATVEPLPSFVELRLGETKSVPCIVHGKPQPFPEWKRITPVTRFSGNTSSEDEKLVIRNAGPYDGGVYECSAKNRAVEEPVVETTEIRVLYAPNVTVEEGVIHTGPGHDLSISCVFLAYPKVEVKWFHDDEEVTNESSNRNIVFGEERDDFEDTFTLQINGVQEEDIGDYKCIGRNNLGEAVGDIQLFAYPHKLEILSVPSGIYSNVYILKWSVESVPKITHYDLLVEEMNDTVKTLVRNSTLLGEEVENNDHRLKDLNANTTYIVHFRANNDFGSTDWLEFRFLTADEGNTQPPPTVTPPPTTPPMPKESTPNSKYRTAGSKTTSSADHIVASLAAIVMVCIAMVL